MARFRLDPGGDRRASAYMRATAALDRPRDTDFAVGLSARLLPRVPISALGELRLRRIDGRTEIAPAAMAVTEFAPQELPLGSRMDAYGQAGYVGGKFATPFADGQLRVTRHIASFDLGQLRAGAGAWGGAQKGVARLDIGPGAVIDFEIAETPARVALDYRIRVAGKAVPQTGVALTISAGF